MVFAKHEKKQGDDLIQTLLFRKKEKYASLLQKVIQNNMLHVTNAVTFSGGGEGGLPFALDSTFSFADAVPPPRDADYWWFIAHWGTSMDAKNVQVLPACLTFETRWWPPLEWMEALSALHPALTCDMYWVDTSLACGHYRTKAATTTSEAFRVPSAERTAFLRTYFPKTVGNPGAEK